MTSAGAGTLTLALRTAQSGLLTNQQILNTVAENVSNANTPGYSRKIANTEQRVLNGVGGGVELSEVTRLVDEGLVKSLRQQLSTASSFSVQEDYYARVQQLFGTPGNNNSVSNVLNNFAASMEALSASPDKTLEQSDMVQNALQVAQTLRDLTEAVQDLRLQADREISDIVEQINVTLVNIADLNDKIVRNKAINADTTDLQDQRDKSLDDLSQLMDIRYFYNSDGDVIVFSAEGKTLVSNVANQLVFSPAGTVASTSTHAEGDFSAIRVSNGTNDIGAQQDITEEIDNGQLKGLIDIRDDVLFNLQAQLDEMAASMRDAVNQAHNRGMSFPGAQTMTGTRTFIDPANQSITFGGTSDTRITLFDSNGDQTATTTIRALIGGATSDIDDLGDDIEAWLQANGAATATAGVNSDGNFEIDLNSTSLYLGLRDETSSTAGSTQQDATIGFDADGNAGTGDAAGNDESVDGFSFFFGLNDFFVDGQPANIHDSNVIGSFGATAATLSFTDSNGSLGSVAIASGDSLETIAAKINNGAANITASVIPDGAGSRLRISHDQGIDLVVTQATGNTLLTDLGLHKADVRTASAIDLREDIVNAPSLIARNTMQWNANLGAAGEYFVSDGDNTNIRGIVDQFNSPNAFLNAGGIPNKNISFPEYAAAIVGRNSSLASDNENSLDINQKLADALQNKSDSFRGVNVDEEMSNLILFEQAYSASARVMTVIQNMFDSLDRIIT